MAKGTNIVELIIHRSKKHPKWGHVIATLFPCGHQKRLGVCRMDGNDWTRRVNDVRIIRFDDYSVTDRDYCGNVKCQESILGNDPILIEELEMLEVEDY